MAWGSSHSFVFTRNLRGDSLHPCSGMWQVGRSQIRRNYTFNGLVSAPEIGLAFDV
jgi:hypothetical protein